MGLMAYLGYYHLDMLRHIGFDNWYRFDMLPMYVDLRWQNDAIGKPGQNGGLPNYWINLALWLFEAGGMAFMSASIAQGAGRKPYAESSRCWMSKETFKCPAGSSTDIVSGLLKRQSSTLATLIVPSQTDDPGFNSCDLWYCPPHRDPERDEPVFLSMTEHGPANNEGQRAMAPIIVLWELSPDELEVFTKAFPEEMARVTGESLEAELATNDPADASA